MGGYVDLPPDMETLSKSGPAPNRMRIYTNMEKCNDGTLCASTNKLPPKRLHTQILHHLNDRLLQAGKRQGGRRVPFAGSPRNRPPAPSYSLYSSPAALWKSSQRSSQLPVLNEQQRHQFLGLWSFWAVIFHSAAAFLSYQAKDLSIILHVLLTAVHLSNLDKLLKGKKGKACVQGKYLLTLLTLLSLPNLNSILTTYSSKSGCGSKHLGLWQQQQIIAPQAGPAVEAPTASPAAPEQRPTSPILSINDLDSSYSSELNSYEEPNQAGGPTAPAGDAPSTLAEGATNPEPQVSGDELEEFEPVTSQASEQETTQAHSIVSAILGELNSIVDSLLGWFNVSHRESIAGCLKSIQSLLWLHAIGTVLALLTWFYVIGSEGASDEQSESSHRAISQIYPDPDPEAGGNGNPWYSLLYPSQALKAIASLGARTPGPQSEEPNPDPDVQRNAKAVTGVLNSVKNIISKSFNGRKPPNRQQQQQQYHHQEHLTNEELKYENGYPRPGQCWHQGEPIRVGHKPRVIEAVVPPVPAAFKIPTVASSEAVAASTTASTEVHPFTRKDRKPLVIINPLNSEDLSRQFYGPARAPSATPKEDLIDFDEVVNGGIGQYSTPASEQVSESINDLGEHATGGRKGRAFTPQVPF